MKDKLKLIICIIFGHCDFQIGEGGFCKRCGWFTFTKEYESIKLLSGK